MPLVKKLIEVGKTSKGVILPKSWLGAIEKETGKPIMEVAMEVNGCLKILPILPRQT